MKLENKWVAVSILIGAVVGMSLAYRVFAKTGLFEQLFPLLGNAPVLVENPTTGQLDANMEAFLDQLATCESGNNEYAKVLDTNGKYSYSVFQFQRQTWEMALAKYNLAPQAEPGEYLNLIFDSELQRKAARLMLQEKDGYKHWAICSKRIGGVDKLPLH